jgi:hypothetical protein
MKREVLDYPFDDLKVEVIEDIFENKSTGTRVKKVLYEDNVYALKVEYALT